MANWYGNNVPSSRTSEDGGQAIIQLKNGPGKVINEFVEQHQIVLERQVKDFDFSASVDKRQQVGSLTSCPGLRSSTACELLLLERK
jgi:hypothetical protein